MALRLEEAKRRFAFQTISLPTAHTQAQMSPAPILELTLIAPLFAYL